MNYGLQARISGSVLVCSELLGGPMVSWLLVQLVSDEQN